MVSVLCGGIGDRARRRPSETGRAGPGGGAVPVRAGACRCRPGVVTARAGGVGARVGRGRARGALRRAGTGVAADAGPLGSGVAGRWVRRAGARRASGAAAYPGAGPRPGRGVEAGEAAAHRGAGASGRGGPSGLGAVGADPAAAVRAAGTSHASGRAGAAGVRPVRGQPPQRAVGLGRVHGPKVAGRNTYLFAVLDDYSRLLVGYRWGHSEDTLRLEAALRNALACRGIPSAFYCDNGSAFVSRQLAYTCAHLGIRIVHSQPGRPQGRGKIERVFGTVRGQFLAEIAPAGGAGTTVDSVDDLNTTFAAWAETVYHRQVHSETGQPPLARFEAGWPDGTGPRLPSTEQLRQAFLWVQTRQVTKTATVSLLGNAYAVDPALVGRKVELAYDPADLTRIEVSWRGTPMGVATPYRIGRHTHPAAKPDTAPPPRPETGIDYLTLLEAARTAEHAGGINFLAITDPNHHHHDNNGDDCEGRP